MSYQPNNVHPMQTAVPPKGDEQKGEKYVVDLIRLIDQGKVQVNKTDLSQFNPSSLQNHYRLDLDDFQIEISHSTHLETGANSFVIIFNNLRNIADGNTEKAILAYIHLTEEQYRRFHSTAEEQIEKLKKIEDEKKFIDAVRPLDDRLAALDSSNKDIFSEKLAEAKHYQQESHTETTDEMPQTTASYAPVIEEIPTDGTDPWADAQNMHENAETEKPAAEHQQLGTYPSSGY